MAATNSTGGGRKNYYGVAYGKLSTRVKEVPEDSIEILETELKSKVQNVEEIDLRNRHVKKTGDYPFSVFYDSLSGVITGFNKDTYDKGISFQLNVHDKDGDNSIVQAKFYSKYTENILNRLLACAPQSEFTFTPYSIPNESDLENGKRIKFYNQGISVRVNGEKIAPKYDGKSTEMPLTERIQDAEGKEITSRVKRINWLFDKFSELYVNLATPAATPPQPVAMSQPAASNATALPPQTAAQAFEPAKTFIEEELDDLPFG